MNISYFSRFASAESFTRLALVETHQRGLENARQVAAVMDGADWLQQFVDYHCPQAVRILDFAHAAQRIAEVAQTLWGQGSAEAAPSPPPSTPKPNKPARDHPWRPSPIGRARCQQNQKI